MKDTLNEDIKQALKSKDTNKLFVLRMIKAKFLEFETAKNAKTLDISAEIQILRKMYADWNKELEALKLANRDFKEIQSQIDVLKSFIPESPSKEEINSTLRDLELDIVLKNTNTIVTLVKSKYPAAESKLIVECIKDYDK